MNAPCPSISTICSVWDATKEYQTSSSAVPEHTAGIPEDAVAHPVLPLTVAFTESEVAEEQLSLLGVVKKDVVIIVAEVSVSTDGQLTLDVRTQ